MTDVVIVSAAVRGRVRFRVPGLRHQPALALQLRDRLGGDDRIHRIQPSTVTGNVLVLFEAARLDVDELRGRIVREAAGYRSRPARATENGSHDLHLPPAVGDAAWHTHTVPEVLRALNDNPGVGLSTEQAERQLLASGPNRLPTPQPKSAVEIIWEQIGSLPMLLLGGAAVASIA